MKAEAAFARAEEVIAELKTESAVKSDRIADLEERLADSLATNDALSAQVSASNEQLVEAEAKWAEQERENAKWAEKERENAKWAEKEREAKFLDVERTLLARIAALEAEVERAKVESLAKKNQMAKLSLQTLLSSQAGDDRALLQTAFGDWRNETSAGRLEWERKQKVAIQEEGTKRCLGLEEEVKTACEALERLKREWQEAKQSEGALKRLQEKLDKLEEEKKVAINQCEEAKKKAAKADSFTNSLQIKLKSAEGRVKELENEVKSLKEKLSAVPVTVSSTQEKPVETVQHPGDIEKEEFYRKRESTLLKEIKDLEDKMKGLSLVERPSDSKSKIYSHSGGSGLAEAERKFKFKIKQMEAQKEEDLSKLRRRIEELEEEVSTGEKALKAAREETSEIDAQKQHAELERDRLQSELSKKTFLPPVTSSSSSSEKNQNSSELPAAKASSSSEKNQNEIELARLRREMAELTTDRAELMKRAERLEGDAASLTVVRKMDSEEFEKKLALADERVAKWKAAVEKNLQDVRKSLRMLVTAPKVAINVGGNEFFIGAAFPHEKIKEAIKNEIIPRFQQCIDVGEE